jgi:autotransporter-associated beta strand protein
MAARKSNRRFTRRRFVMSLGSLMRLIVLSAVTASMLFCNAPAVKAAQYFWVGDDNASWNTIIGPGGTNWSSSPDFNNGTGGATALPSSTSDVFFVLPGAANLTTELGANFSINSLTFNTFATSAVQINDTPGTHTLTIGAGGITVNGPSTYTINAPIVLGAAEKWSNNSANPLTVNGVISGGNNLTIGGSGTMVFGGANTYTGATNISTGTLTLSGANGSITGTSGITLGAGTILNLDNTAVNNNNRIASGTGITSNGGFVNLLGSSTAATSQTIGTLTLGPGATYVTITPGSGQTATLTYGAAGTLASFNHTIGGTVTFSGTGTHMAPNVTLVNPTNPIIGGWATIGTLNSATNNTLDWATVNGGGQIVPLSTYQNLSTTAVATDNAKADFVNTNGGAGGQVTFDTAQNVTVNSLYLTGDTTPGTASIPGTAGTNSQINWTAPAATGNDGTNAQAATGTLTITSGGIISNNATGTAYYDNKAPNNNMAFIGPHPGTAVQGGSPGTNDNNQSYQGRITSTFEPTSTTAELDVFTAANGNLAISSIIVDPDATHHLWLVKSGPGILDLSNGNTQNRKGTNTFTGKVVINEGILLINTSANLGPNPASATPDAVQFNGGELRTYAGLTPNTNQGWSVGTRGGTFSYTGGGTSNIQNKITGVGGFTFYSRAAGGGTNELINLNNSQGGATAGGGSNGNSDYQGATNIWIAITDGSYGSFSNGVGQYGRVAWTQNNQIPAASAMTMNIVDDTAAHAVQPNGVTRTDNNLTYVCSVDFLGHSDHFGSLAGNINIRDFSLATGLANPTLTLGANNLSTVYSGSIYGAVPTRSQNADLLSSIAAGTGQVIKMGTGTQTFSGTNNFFTGATTNNTGALNINGGKMLIGDPAFVSAGPSTALLTTTDGSAVAGAVNVGNGATVGALGGNGTINGPVVVTSTGVLAPAMTATSFNTLTLSFNPLLTVTNALTINAGGSLNYNFGAPGTGDLVNLTGTGNLVIGAGTDILNVNQLSGFGIGLYPLITVSGGGTFTDNASFTVNGKPNFNYVVYKPGQAIDPSLGGGVAPANQLTLGVLQGNPALTWIGNVSGTWDINTTANWSGDNTKFTTGANVTFDDFATGGHNNPITVVAGGVNPHSIVIAGTGTLVGGQDFVFAGGPITVDTSIVKNQAGSVAFNNNVTTPITTVTGGDVTIGSGASYNSTSNFTLTGGTLTVNGTLSSPALSTAAGTTLTVNASGQLGANTSLIAGDTTTFNQAAQSMASISGPGALALNGTALTLTSGASSYSGNISGNGSILVNGATANVTLSGNNNYSGGTSVTAGTLKAGSLTAFGTTTTLPISGTGTLDINGFGFNASTYAITVGGAGVGGNGAIINTGAAQINGLLGFTMTADTTIGGIGRWDVRNNGATPATVTGGGFDLTKTGTNAIGLATGNTTVTGVKNININQGTLIVADNGSINNSVPGSITINGGGTLSVGNYAATTGVVISKPIVLAGGTLQTDSASANGNATITLPISLNANSNINAQATSTLTLNGALTAGTSNTAGVTYGGAGTVLLGAGGTYGGSTTVNGGTVRSGLDNALPVATNLTIGGGTLDLAGHNQSVNSLAGTAGAVTNSAASPTSTLTVTGSTSTNYGGSLTGGVALTQAGTGTLTLSGNSSHTGGTLINAGGTVATGASSSGNPLGTGAVSLNGGTLVIGQFGNAVSGFNGGNGWTVNSTGITSAAFPSANVLQLTDNAANEARSAFFNAPIPINQNFTASFTYTPSGAIAADGVTFTLQNDPRGPTALGGGGGSLGYAGITNSVAVELNLFNGNPPTPGTAQASGGILNGLYLPTDPVVLTSGHPIAVTLAYDAPTQTITETLNDAIANTSFSTQYGIGVPDNVLGNTAFIGFTGATGGSTSTQQISNFTFTQPVGSAVYSNAVNLSAGTTSTINVAATSANPVITMGGLNVGAGGAATLNVAPATGVPAVQSYGLTLGATALGSNAIFNVANNGTGAGTLTLGAVTDGGSNSSITKTGAGTLVLSAGGTYGGATIVNAGTLVVTNTSGSATGTGPVTIAAGSTLAGTGTISGNLDLSGHLAPGTVVSPIGTLHLGATSLNTGSILDYDLAGPAAFDSAVVNGSLTLGSNITVNVNALPGLSLGTYNLATATGHTGAPTFTVNHTGGNPAFTYNVGLVGDNIVLTVGGGVNQTWKNTAGTGLWNTTDANWSGASTTYADNTFNEVFDDSAGAANGNVSIPASVSPLGVLFANNAVPYTISGAGAISGPTAVVINGPGTVTLASPNTYSGGTSLVAGVLNINDPAAIGTGTLVIGGGTLDSPNSSITLVNNNPELWANSFTYGGTNDLNLGTGTVTLGTSPTINVVARNLTVGGPIVDNGAGFGFTKTGAGTMTLLGANVFSGTLSVSNGTLQASGSGTLGGANASVSVSGTGTLDLGGSTQSIKNFSMSAGTVQSGTLSASNSFAFSNPADLQIDITLAGTGTLTKSAAGNLTLTAANTYTGGTAINGGTITIATDGNLGVPATLTLNGGTLNVTAGTAAGAAAGTSTLATGRTINLGAGGGTLNIPFTNPAVAGTDSTANATSLVYNGLITGPGGLTVTGVAGANQVQQSIVALSQPATYQGNTTINNAVAEVNSGTTGTNNGAAVVNVLPVTTVLNLINNGAWNIQSGSSSLTVAGLTGDATGRFGTTNQTSASNLTIGGAGSYSFPGVIGALTVSGKTGGNGILSLTMAGTGTQVLSGTNTYGGGTTINAGTLSISNDNNLGAATGALNINGGTLLLTAPVTSSRPVVVGSPNATVNVAAAANAWTLSGAVTGTGTLNLTGTGNLNVPAALTVAGTAAINAAGTISIADATTLTLQKGATRLTNQAKDLSITGTGTLDLGNHELLLTNATPASVKAALGHAYDPNGNADWGQSGITSSVAHANPTSFSVGYAYGGDQSAQDAGVTTKGGAPLGAAQTIIRPVLTGDANMDGVVDFFDITQVLGYKYNAGGSNAAYTDGDLDYSGAVDFFDIVLLLSANYNSGQNYLGAAANHSGTPALTHKAGVASSGVVLPSATTLGTSGDGKPDFAYNPNTGDLKFFIDGKSVPTFISSLAVQSTSGMLLPAGASSAMAGSVGATLTASTIAGSLTNSPGFSDGFDLGNILPTGLTGAQLTADLTVRYQVLNNGGLVAGDVTVPEPAGLALLGLAGAALLARRRRS